MTAAIIGSFIGTTIALIIVVGGCHLYDNNQDQKRKDHFKR